MIRFFFWAGWLMTIVTMLLLALCVHNRAFLVAALPTGAAAAWAFMFRHQLLRYPREIAGRAIMAVDGEINFVADYDGSFVLYTDSSATRMMKHYVSKPMVITIHGDQLLEWWLVEEHSRTIRGTIHRQDRGRVVIKKEQGQKFLCTLKLEEVHHALMALKPSQVVDLVVESGCVINVRPVIEQEQELMPA